MKRRKKILKLISPIAIIAIGAIAICISLELYKQRDITPEQTSASSQSVSSKPPPIFAYFDQASSWRMGEPFYRDSIYQLPTNQTTSDYLECATGTKAGDLQYPGCQRGDWSEQTTHWYVQVPKNLDDTRVQEEFKKLYQAAEQAKYGRSIIIDVKHVFYNCSDIYCTFASDEYANRWASLVSIIKEPRIAIFAIDEPFWTFCYSQRYTETCINTQIGLLNLIIKITRANFPHSGILLNTNASSVSCMNKMNIDLSSLTNDCIEEGSCVLLGLSAQNRVNSFDDLGITGVYGSSICRSYESTGMGYDDWFTNARQLFGIYEPARLYVFSAGTLTQSMVDFCAGKPWPCVGNENALKHYAVRQLDYAENYEFAGVIPWEWDNWGNEVSIKSDIQIADSIYHVRRLYECWGKYVTTGNSTCWEVNPGYENWYPDPKKTACSDDYYVDCICSDNSSGTKLCHKKGYIDESLGGICMWGRHSYCEECQNCDAN